MKGSKRGSFKRGILAYISDGIKGIILKARVLIARISARGAERGVYYVNGPDTLPPPLTKEEEAEYER